MENHGNEKSGICAAFSIEKKRKKSIVQPMMGNCSLVIQSEYCVPCLQKEYTITVMTGYFSACPLVLPAANG